MAKYNIAKRAREWADNFLHMTNYGRRINIAKSVERLMREAYTAGQDSILEEKGTVTDE